MKRRRTSPIFYCIVSALVILLAISVWRNVSDIRQRNFERERLINHVYTHFRDTEMNLDWILENHANPLGMEDFGHAVRLSLEGAA